MWGSGHRDSISGFAVPVLLISLSCSYDFPEELEQLSPSYSCEIVHQVFWDPPVQTQLHHIQHSLCPLWTPIYFKPVINQTLKFWSRWTCPQWKHSWHQWYLHPFGALFPNRLSSMLQTTANLGGKQHNTVAWKQYVSGQLQKWERSLLQAEKASCCKEVGASQIPLDVMQAFISPVSLSPHRKREAPSLQRAKGWDTCCEWCRESEGKGSLLTYLQRHFCLQAALPIVL